VEKWGNQARNNPSTARPTTGLTQAHCVQAITLHENAVHGALLCFQNENSPQYIAVEKVSEHDFNKLDEERGSFSFYNSETRYGQKHFQWSFAEKIVSSELDELQEKDFHR